MNAFDHSKHIYSSPDFDAVVNDAMEFFNNTPVYSALHPQRFPGTGVYALYCVSSLGIYAKFSSINSPTLHIPIYVGKAVPKGWRQARQPRSRNTQSYELHNRLREHIRSLDLGTNLERNDFFYRFMILENQESDLIGAVEASLIRKYQPLWNTLIDGFGNHDPGKGRYAQAKSDWDVCHPGRLWAEKCSVTPNSRTELLQKIQRFMDDLSAENV